MTAKRRKKLVENYSALKWLLFALSSTAFIKSLFICIAGCCSLLFIIIIAYVGALLRTRRGGEREIERLC
jgi:hypothetical protein